MQFKLKPLVVLLLTGLTCSGAGLVNPTITPTGGVGGGNTNGQSAAQVATQIRQSNDTVFASTYIGQVSGAGSDTVITRLTIVGGNVTTYDFSSGKRLRTNSAAPFDWTLWNTNGTETRGTGSVTKVTIDRNGNINLPQSGGGSIVGQTAQFSQALTAGNGGFTVPASGSPLTMLYTTNGANATNVMILRTNGEVAVASLGSGLSYDATTATLSSSGGGSTIPSNLGVVTNTAGGVVGVTTAMPGTWIKSASIPITAADTSWPDRTNFYNVTNASAGNAVVVVGPDANNNFWLKGTNWPTGGGSIPNDLVTNYGTASVTVPTAFNVTNSADRTVVRLGVVGATTLTPILGDSPVSLTTIGTTNGGGVGVNIVANYFSAGRGFIGSSGGIFIQSNGVAGVNGYYYMDGSSAIHMGLPSTGDLIKLDGQTGTGTFSGGPVSLIPTNAAVIYTSNGVAATLPFGITNTLAGRAQPVIQYYVVDAVTGTPTLTFSNETSGIKIRISNGSLAFIETNFCVLPVTSTNTIWKARDESTGSGASVGILTNWFIGL
jgi:hypothetical protein